MLQRRQTTIDKEWEQKLVVVNEKLAQITASRDWLEKNLMESTERLVYLPSHPYCDENHSHELFYVIFYFFCRCSNTFGAMNKHVKGWGSIHFILDSLSSHFNLHV